MNLNFDEWKDSLGLRVWWRKVKAMFEQVQEAVNAESDARGEKDSSLQTQISNEYQSRINGDTALEKKITAEENARNQAVSAEAKLRSDADKVLQGKIDAEAAQFTDEQKNFLKTWTYNGFSAKTTSDVEVPFLTLSDKDDGCIMFFDKETGTYINLGVDDVKKIHGIQALIDAEAEERIEGDKKALITNTVTGNAITITDTADYPLQDLAVYGNSTQDGVPTPTTPIDIVSVGDSGNINVTISNIDNSKSQTLTLPLTAPLRAIGDNKDTICVQNNKLGVLRKVSNAFYDDGSNVQELLVSSGGTPKVQRVRSTLNIKPFYIDDYTANAMSDKFTSCKWEEQYNQGKVSSVVIQNTYKMPINYTFPLNTFSNKSEFTEMFKDNPIELYYLIKPTFEPFSEDIQTVFKSLVTYLGTTNVSNTEGADVSISYLVNNQTTNDIIHLIEDKFRELENITA